MRQALRLAFLVSGMMKTILQDGQLSHLSLAKIPLKLPIRWAERDSRPRLSAESPQLCSIGNGYSRTLKRN
jgi:hypothetical protein